LELLHCTHSKCGNEPPCHKRATLFTRMHAPAAMSACSKRSVAHSAKLKAGEAGLYAGETPLYAGDMPLYAGDTGL
jgi:hypothetical protein